MQRRRVLAFVIAVAIVTATAATWVLAHDTADEPPVAAPPPAAPRAPDRAPIEGHPPADRWEVAVAIVRPEVEEAVIHRARPATTGSSGAAADASPGRERRASHSSTVADVPEVVAHLDEQAAASAAASAGLTPIPSPGLSWGSAQHPDGWAFDNPTRIGSPLVFPVVEDGGDWLRVQFPARPNQQTGWIERDDVRIMRHRWHAEVNVTTNRLRVWNGDSLELDTAVVAGTAYTPTPLGRFYFNEKQPQANPYGAYGTWIIATNGFSEVHERFSGEVPMFTLHGTPYPETMGMDLSNGCVRLTNEHIELLAERMPMGTPLDVVA